MTSEVSWSRQEKALEDEAINRLLDELKAESGPVPEEIVAEAERYCHFLILDTQKQSNHLARSSTL
jgi:hypothetical protein